MSDFFTRLAELALGVATVVQPEIIPRFAQGPEVALGVPSDSLWPDSAEDSAGEATLPSREPATSAHEEPARAARQTENVQPSLASNSPLTPDEGIPNEVIPYQAYDLKAKKGRGESVSHDDDVAPNSVTATPGKSAIETHGPAAPRTPPKYSADLEQESQPPAATIRLPQREPGSSMDALAAKPVETSAPVETSIPVATSDHVGSSVPKEMSAQTSLPSTTSTLVEISAHVETAETTTSSESQDGESLSARVEPVMPVPMQANSERPGGEFTESPAVGTAAAAESAPGSNQSILRDARVSPARGEAIQFSATANKTSEDEVVGRVDAAGRVDGLADRPPSSSALTHQNAQALPRETSGLSADEDEAVTVSMKSLPDGPLSISQLAIPAREPSPVETDARVSRSTANAESDSPQPVESNLSAARLEVAAGPTKVKSATTDQTAEVKGELDSASSTRGSVTMNRPPMPRQSPLTIEIAAHAEASQALPTDANDAEPAPAAPNSSFPKTDAARSHLTANTAPESESPPCESDSTAARPELETRPKLETDTARRELETLAGLVGVETPAARFQVETAALRSEVKAIAPRVDVETAAPLLEPTRTAEAEAGAARFHSSPSKNSPTPARSFPAAATLATAEMPSGSSSRELRNSKQRVEAVADQSGAFEGQLREPEASANPSRHKAADGRHSEAGPERQSEFSASPSAPSSGPPLAQKSSLPSAQEPRGAARDTRVPRKGEKQTTIASAPDGLPLVDPVAAPWPLLDQSPDQSPEQAAHQTREKDGQRVNEVAVRAVANSSNTTPKSAGPRSRTSALAKLNGVAERRPASFAEAWHLEDAAGRLTNEHVGEPPGDRAGEHAAEHARNQKPGADSEADLVAGDSETESSVTPSVSPSPRTAFVDLGGVRTDGALASEIERQAGGNPQTRDVNIRTGHHLAGGDKTAVISNSQTRKQVAQKTAAVAFAPRSSVTERSSTETKRLPAHPNAGVPPEKGVTRIESPKQSVEPTKPLIGSRTRQAEGTGAATRSNLPHRSVPRFSGAPIAQSFPEQQTRCGSEWRQAEQSLTSARATIRVNVGRIEVRATPPRKASEPYRKPAAARPKLSLEDYLNRRKGGGR